LPHPIIRANIIPMPTIRILKILYVLAGTLWTAYWSTFLLHDHVKTHTPLSLGTLYCLLLFVTVPTLGYVLLFKLFPLANRRFRR